MKLFILFILSFTVLFGVDAKKDVDFNDLFSQLDKVISAKKDKGKVEKEKTEYRKESTSKREDNYKKFNEAAKKYHIFRANKILISVKKLIKEYEVQASGSLYVQRYSFIGNKKFAYVSSKDLNNLIASLELKGKQLKNLYNYNNLLTDIKNYDIKTISKVLIIVEQDIMNMRGMGIKKLSLKKKNINDEVPIKLQINKTFNNNVKVIDINKDIAILKFTIS